jgi:hypothetical protein
MESKRDRPWIFRTYAGHSTARESNALYREVIKVCYSQLAYLTTAGMFGMLALFWLLVPSDFLASSHRLPVQLLTPRLLYWAGGFFLLGVTAFSIWRAFFDHVPVLVLDENGLRDRRLNFVLVPWSRLVRAEVRSKSILSIAVLLQFDRALLLPRYPRDALFSPIVRAVRKLMGLRPPLLETRELLIPLTDLDTTYREIFDYIRRLAPHASVGS